MAASGGRVWDESFQCASTAGVLTGYQIVMSTAQDLASLCTGTSMGVGGPKGVVQNDPDSGEAATVRLYGLSKVIAGGSISVGDHITSTTAGLAATATTGQCAIGWANSASTASGQVIEVFLTGPQALV